MGRSVPLGGGIGPAFWVALGAAALLGGFWLERAGVSGFYPRYYRLTELLLVLAAVCVALVALLARGPDAPDAAEPLPPALPAAPEGPPSGEGLREPGDSGEPPAAGDPNAPAPAAPGVGVGAGAEAPRPGPPPGEGAARTPDGPSGAPRPMP